MFMVRFVILAHDFPQPHWDLFWEEGSELRAWRLFGSLAEGAEIVAEPAPNHRLFYLDYEGPVSGNRGTVWRVEAGALVVEVDTAELVRCRICGERWQGTLSFSRTPEGWRCRSGRTSC